MAHWETRLRRWLSEGHLAEARVEPLPGDVSPRRYARLRPPEGRSVIAAVYPSELRETFSRFMATTILLAQRGVPVPGILHCDIDAGVMLLEDAGNCTLYEANLDWESCLPHLCTAASHLRQIRQLDPSEVGRLNPPLDVNLLWKEIDLTWSFVLEPQRLVGKAAFKQALRDALRRLCQELGDVPPVPCHRDFMARNLMLQENDAGLIVIDHQDLRLGPPGYDLASLLNDSLFPPPRVVRSVLAVALGTAEELVVYRRAAAQRALKIVGTFHRFAAAGSPRYLPLVPLALQRALENLETLPETADLTADLREHWRTRLSLEETA